MARLKLTQPAAGLARTVPSVVAEPHGLSSPAAAPSARAAERAERGGRSELLLGLVGALALALVAFVAAGGNNLASNTWVQVGLIVLGAAAAVAAVLFAEHGRGPGTAALLAFATLAALTYASIAWSVQPANSWVEGNRTLSYFGVFAGALLTARLAGGRWRALLGAVATASTVACAYALLVKVFPASLDPNDPLGRLRAPLDYWNAVGLLAAMGIPGCLWAAARPTAPRWLRVLALPALSLLTAALALTFSRGAILVAVVGTGVWFALAPLRLRSALILAGGAAAGAAIAAWGAAHPGISSDNVPAAARIAAGHSFGLVILAALALSTLAGVGIAAALERVVLTPRLRRRIGAALIGLLALVPLAGLGRLAASHRGFTGEISHLWQTLTNTNGGTGNQPGRLAQLSNSRPHYWSLALQIGAHHPLAGAGADGFATAQSRYESGPLAGAPVKSAHGYLMQTFADFGALGLAVALALTLSWGLATARTFELRLRWRRRERTPRPPPGPGASAERTGLVALLAIVLTFGVHSLIDWTWFIPGVAVPALACAGWLAGRGPLSRPPARRARPRALSRAPGAVAGLAAILALTLVAGWFVVQPLRSAQAYSAAYAAALDGRGAAAVADARSAAAEDPVSVQPLFLLSALYGRLGLPAAARAELAQAARRQPANPQSWEQLGCYDLSHGRGGLGGAELRRALALEPAVSELASDPGAFCASLEG